SYRHPSEIYQEIASLTPLFAGVTYERLEGYKSLQWPVAADGTDEPLLYVKRFPFPDGKARLHPVAMSSPAEPADREFDLHFNNGCMLEHFHEGNMTYRAPVSARKSRTRSSRFPLNLPQNEVFKAGPGCSSSRLTANLESAPWSPTAF